jgi:hypothetical protein
MQSMVFSMKMQTITNYVYFNLRYLNCARDKRQEILLVPEDAKRPK